MGSIRILFSILSIVTIVIFPCYSKADDVSKPNPHFSSSLFTEDRISLQFSLGALFSPVGFASRTDVFNYAQFNVRLGWMFSSPSDSQSIFRGNHQAIFEVSNSYIWKGFGNYIGGITLLYRYNFVQPDTSFIPFFQAGAGVVYTNGYKEYPQTAIGQAIEFTPQSSLGLSYLINKNWSAEIEFMFHHISNAGLDERNHGINAGGGFLSITYYFDKLWK